MPILKEEDFHKNPQGKIICGIKWKILTHLGLETHECYQYNSLAELQKEVNFMLNNRYFYYVEVVTHVGQYEKMKTVFKLDKYYKTYK